MSDTDYANLDYCGYNFNDAMNAWMYLYNLFIINNWQVFTGGLVAATSKWATLYTTCFILFFSTVIMNVIVSFVIDAFLLEYDLKLSNFETDLEQRIRRRSFVAVPPRSSVTAQSQAQATTFREAADEASTQFRIIPQKTKNVDVLLQRMFEQDIPPPAELGDESVLS